jgi:hypothetical protein
MAVGDLEARILDAVRAVAEAVSTGDVPAARVYRRDVPSVVPGRDTLPLVVVSRTPGRTYGRRKALRWVEWTFPVTCLLACSAGGQVATTADWRHAWGPRLIEALEEAELVSEAVDVSPDALLQLDLAAFTAAGIFAPTVSVTVTARTPDPPE